MRAWNVVNFGQRPNIVTTPIPEPKPGQVQLRIAACGLNFADLLMLDGSYQQTPPLPFTPGLELAGTITALGAGVVDFSLGQNVAVFAGTGGLAEFGCFAQERCVPIPDQMPLTEAAGFQIAYGTSHLALADRANLRAGERVAILGAAGGVGLTAVEIARALGAETIAIARGQEKQKLARQKGADHTLDADPSTIREALLELGGIDILYDPVGGALAEQAARAIKPMGRHLVIGFASGDIPRIKANHIMVKNIDIIGFYWGAYFQFAPDLVKSSLSSLVQMTQRGEIAPHISDVIPFKHAMSGLDLLKSRRATGKVVVKIADDIQ